MSEDSKRFRAAMKAKAKARAEQKSEKTDCSSFGPTESDPINADKKTGMRPISKRAYKRGGKVQGEDAMHHAGRAKRKEGGTADAGKSYYNVDLKDADKDREGYVKREGGLKKGGRTKKSVGGPDSGGGPLGGFKTVTSPQQKTAMDAVRGNNPAGVSNSILDSRKKGGKVKK